MESWGRATQTEGSRRSWWECLEKFRLLHRLPRPRGQLCTQCLLGSVPQGFIMRYNKGRNLLPIKVHLQRSKYQ